MIMPPDTAANQPARASSADPDDPPALPDRSPSDWGDSPEPDDEERLTLDRPPHWDSA